MADLIDEIPDGYRPVGSFSCATCGGTVEVYAPEDPAGEVIVHSDDDGCECDDPGVPGFLVELVRERGDLVSALKAVSELGADHLDAVQPAARRSGRGRPRRRGKGAR